MIAICKNCGRNKNIKPYRADSFRFCSTKCHGESLKGTSPWNKGTRGLMGISSTSFKNGNIPWNKGTRKVTECSNCKKDSFWIQKGSVCRACGFLVKESHPRYFLDRSRLKRSDIIKNDPARKEWTRAVKNRDGWHCKMSNGDCSGKLEAHHILPWSKFPSLRYEIKNGITLCHFHHPRRREDEIKLSPYFQSLVASVA